MYFLERGKWPQESGLVRRFSDVAKEKEASLELQRNIEQLTGKSDMFGVVEGILDGLQARLVDFYNAEKVLCKEASLAPVRFKIHRNGKPQAFRLQFHQMQRPGATEEASSPGVGNLFALLPWKVSMLLLPKIDFLMSPQKTGDGSRALKFNRITVRRSPIEEARAVLLAGSFFRKWGRNRKSKERFVQYDDVHNVIVWKNMVSDKVPRGVVPLALIQDVLVGVQTPVMRNIRSSRLRSDAVFSIVSKNRTLDLQADNMNQRDRWATGAKALFKEFAQKQIVLEGSGGIQRQLEEPVVPKHLVKCLKEYPPKFRCEKCALKTAFLELHDKGALDGEGSPKKPVQDVVYCL